MLNNRPYDAGNTGAAHDFGAKRASKSPESTSQAAPFYAPVISTTPQPLSPSALWADGDGSVKTSPFRDQDTDMNNDGCAGFVADLSAYLDGELNAEQTRQTAAHVGKCPRCADILDSMQTTDEMIEREWRESAPLPSLLHQEQAVDNIMAALPSIPVETVAFAARRVHARTRWMRFATGIAGVVALSASLWSSYRLGYANGRRSVAQSSLDTGLLDRSAQTSAPRAFAPMPSLRLTPAALLLSAPSAFSRPQPSLPPSFLPPSLPPQQRFYTRSAPVVISPPLSSARAAVFP